MQVSVGLHESDELRPRRKKLVRFYSKLWNSYIYIGYSCTADLVELYFFAGT